jgi:hypothetical protein
VARAQQSQLGSHHGDIVIQKSFGRAVLIVFLCATLSMPARADKLQSDADNIIIGIVVMVVALVVGTAVAIHYSKKRTITGCVSSGANGMTVTDEKDRQTYALSGNTVGITPGDRMRLRGKRVKSKSDKTLVWEAGSVAKDFGVCQP